MGRLRKKGKEESQQGKWRGKAHCQGTGLSQCAQGTATTYREVLRPQEHFGAGLESGPKGLWVGA